MEDLKEKLLVSFINEYVNDVYSVVFRELLVNDDYLDNLVFKDDFDERLNEFMGKYWDQLVLIYGGNEIDGVPLDDVVKRNFLFDVRHAVEMEVRNRLMNDVVRFKERLVDSMDYVMENWKSPNVDESVYNSRLREVYDNMGYIIRVLNHFWYE